MFLSIHNYDKSTQDICVAALNSLGPILAKYDVILGNTDLIGSCAIHQHVYVLDRVSGIKDGEDAYEVIAQVIIQHFKDCGLKFEPRIVNDTPHV